MQPIFEQMRDGVLRRRVMLSLFHRWCGPLPGLQALATPAGRLALLDRLQLLSRLCAAREARGVLSGPATRGSE
jgi:hypothetical protein